MKNIVLSVFAVLGLFSASAYAFPTPDEMAANFQICEQSDPSWHGRFGQYLVSFDIYKAAQICRAQMPAQKPQLMSCNTDNGWIFAGYYCQDIVLE